MPFKDKRRYQNYMAEYMKEYRSTERALKQAILADVEKMGKLKVEFPEVYKLFAAERALKRLKRR